MSKPSIFEEEIILVNEVLRSGNLVQGKYIKQLEDHFVLYSQVPYASAVTSATAGLHLALVTLGIGPGDEVIVPAFSFMATANVVELVGATPIFVDIDEFTFNIDMDLVERHITSKTVAIMPVHQFGLACDMDPLVALAEKHDLIIIEDAACAMGALYKGVHVGYFGDFGSFSLHPRKSITSGEGGLLVTNDADLDSYIKIIRNHGLEMIDGHVEFTEFGYNYRLTDFQGILADSQLSRLPEILQHKQQLAAVYNNYLPDEELVRLPYVPLYTSHTWQTYHIVLDSSICRTEIIETLKARGIGSNYGAQCMPYMASFKRKYGLDCERLYPHALTAYKQGLALPMYSELTIEEAEYVASTLCRILP